ncbi:MAG TPA: restriction endonuclease subunit S [Rhodocyclaceae bacterium]|uniref:Type I restriction modification DNA specificity domain-containing protein n=1 Tax=Hydrocarboniphaga effusa AP103 TaxID=1172194 RepID=I8TEK3_9GAMM|nr:MULTISPECIES: restriction endonuclease subunit S [Hydrocarboniphaga]EIT72128.1 hypothetical protein WQQ_22650 [Hydrocarboniphaga effusa AP103]MDZ4079730.1 restriction endonuclease subunit S [Hydrocarboniphaga sp.]
MSKTLPHGWQISNLNELARAVGGGTPSKAEPANWINGTIPWVSPKDMKRFFIGAAEDQITEAAAERLSVVPAESVMTVVRSGILSRTLPVAINTVPVTVNQDMRAFVPEPQEIAKLTALPPGWAWTSIGQCFHVGVGATPSRKEAAYWNGPIPWVSSGEVQFGRVRKTKECITSSGLENSSTQLNPPGSVLLGMIGEGKTRGQVAILDIEAANNQNCAAIWVSEAGIPPEYVYFWLWSRYDETRRGSSGNNQPALNKSIIEAIPLPLPPLAEIKEITALVEQRFEQIHRQVDALSLSLKQSTAQRQNILRAAFAGQLVPQDPNDEPASVLLERIRAERAATHGTKPRKSKATRKEKS